MSRSDDVRRGRVSLSLSPKMQCKCGWRVRGKQAVVSLVFIFIAALTQTRVATRVYDNTRSTARANLPRLWSTKLGNQQNFNFSVDHVHRHAALLFKSAHAFSPFRHPLHTHPVCTQLRKQTSLSPTLYQLLKHVWPWKRWKGSVTFEFSIIRWLMMVDFVLCVGTWQGWC
jgi:hypothetical protein